MAQKYKCLQTALAIACESVEQLDRIDQLIARTLPTILKQFELHLQTILKRLIQVSINKQCSTSSISELKQLYSRTLQLYSLSIKKDDALKFAGHLKNVLQMIRRSAVIQC